MLKAARDAVSQVGETVEAFEQPARLMAESKLNESAWIPSGDERGQMGAEGAVNLVVALVVGSLMAAFLLPIAIDELAGVDTSAWSDGAAALWNILPVMVVLAVFLFFVGVALRRSGRL